MKNTWGRLLTLALALIMALSCLAFVGCENDTPQDPDTQDPGTQNPGTQDPGTQDPTEGSGEDYLLSIPKKDYGKTFTFLTHGGRMRSGEVYFESEDEVIGDPVDTAIFYRNNRVAEHLGVTFDLISDPNGTYDKRSAYISRVQQSYNSGDQDFQLISIYEACASELVVLGLGADANSLEAIDFSSPWYVQSWIENTLINDRVYMLLSDLSYTMWQFINAMYLNKQLSDELNITDSLYTMAADGDLTLDYVMSCAELVTEDDGDDIWDENDKYGICFNVFNCRAFLTYFDIPVVAKDDIGEYELVYYTERTENVYSTLQDYMFNYNYVYLNNKVIKGDHNNYTVTLPMFMEDRLLFFPGQLEWSQELRDMDGAFGILPLPKFNDEQENYRTHSNDVFTVFVIPAHASDLEFCATVFDTLSAENKYSVIPAFYDVVLKGRTTRDEQSVEMLDLIRENLYFDFAFAHTASLSGMWAHYGNDIAAPVNTSFKTSYDRNLSMYQEKLSALMDAYWKIR